MVFLSLPRRRVSPNERSGGWECCGGECSEGASEELEGDWDGREEERASREGG